MKCGLEELEVGDQAGRDRTDVEVSKGDEKQGGPGKVRVEVVQARNYRPELVPDGVLGEVLQPAANRVSASVAGERVEPEKRGIHEKHEGADVHVPPLAVAISKGNDRVIGQDHVKNQTGIEEPAVCVLADQRCARLAGVLGLWLCDGACGR